MPKATIQHLKNEGFRVDMFGAGMTALEFDTFLQEPIDEAGNWAAEQIGVALYTATGAGYAFDCIKRAEVCFASAQLWKKRVAFADSQPSVELQASEYLNRREYFAHERAMWECAQSNLAEAMRILGLDASALSGVPAFASGFIETGSFPLSSTGALNA